MMKYPSDKYYVAYSSKFFDTDIISGPFSSRIKAEREVDHLLEDPRNSEFKVLLLVGD